MSAQRGQIRSYASLPRIDPFHPISRGLVFCVTGSNPFYDLTNNCKATVTGSPAFTTTPEGPGLWVGDRSGTYASLTNYVSFSSPRALFTGGNATFLVRCNPLVYPTPNGAFTGTLAYGKAADVIYNLAIAGNSGNTTFEVQNSGGSYQDAPILTAPSIGVVHQLAGVINGATTTCYIDGVGSSSSYTGTPKSGDASYSIGLGLDWYNSDSHRVIDGIIPFAAIWNRALTSAELLQLYLDPYCFLIYPEDEPPLVGVTSGTVNVNLTGVSATAAVGTPTVTGFGNVTLTGVAATAAVGTLTVSAKANVTLTGVSATAAVNVPTVTAAANVFPTGVAGTTAVNIPTVTGFANVTLSGVAATSAVGTPTVTVGGAINVTLTGVGATAAVGVPTVTGFANVTLTGVSATSAIGTLTTSAAANANITGVAATAAVNTPTVTGAANVPLTGVSATAVANDVTVSVPTGVSVTLTGVGAIAYVGTLTTNLDQVAGVTFGGGSSYRQRDIDQAIREWQEERARARKKFKKKKVLQAVEAAIEVLEVATSKGLLGALPAIELKEAVEELPASPPLKLLVDLKEQTKLLERLLDEEDEEEIMLMAWAME